MTRKGEGLMTDPNLLAAATKNYSGFHLVCACLAARRLYESGVVVEEIARQAKRSPSTIRKWLKDAGTRKVE